MLLGVLLTGVYKVCEKFTTHETEVSSKQEIEEKMGENGVAFVKFYAPWCGWCKKLQPDWDKLTAQYDNTEVNGKTVRILSVNCDEHKEVGKEYNVTGFPTLKTITHGSVKDYNNKRTFDALESHVKSL